MGIECGGEAMIRKPYPDLQRIAADLAVRIGENADGGTARAIYTAMSNERDRCLGLAALQLKDSIHFDSFVGHLRSGERPWR